MRVSVRVRDAVIWVDVGPGHQRLKWLALVALQRYAEMAPADSTIPLSHAHVATGLMDVEGNELPPNKSIRVALADGQEVYALLQADDDDNAAIKGAKGTSRFLMMQGAAPSKCIISGPGVTYALVGQAAFFSLQARDTYGNLTSNGGEKFEVKVSVPDGLTGRQAAETQPDPPATITDRGDGSYIVSHTMTRKGRYDVSVELDGEPIAGSPCARSPTTALLSLSTLAPLPWSAPAPLRHLTHRPSPAPRSACSRDGRGEDLRAADDQMDAAPHRLGPGAGSRACRLLARRGVHLRPLADSLWWARRVGEAWQ